MTAQHLSLIDGIWVPGDHLSKKRNPSDLIGHSAVATAEDDRWISRMYGRG